MDTLQVEDTSSARKDEGSFVKVAKFQECLGTDSHNVTRDDLMVSPRGK
jgi:hypothetical protein